MEQNPNSVSSSERKDDNMKAMFLKLVIGRGSTQTRP
jgi:hypothetical protein